MNCQNCQKEIDSDSKFCVFCSAKVENVNKKPIEISNINKPDDDLKSLKSKPWFRLLKILYITGFCFSIFYVSIKIYNEVDPSKIVFDNKKTIITCDSGNSASAKDINLDLNLGSGGFGTIGETLKNPEGKGRINYRGVANSNYPILKFCNSQKINNYKDAEDAYNNIPHNYKIDLQYKFERFKFLSYLVVGLISLVIIFEIFKQLGYYIFLGKIRHSWLTAKLIKIWK